MKSKMNATRTIPRMNVTTSASGVLQRDALERDRHRLRRIDGALEGVVHLLPLQYLERTFRAAEEIPHRLVVDRVALLFERLDVPRALLHHIRDLHPVHGGLQLASGAGQHVTQSRGE